MRVPVDAHGLGEVTVAEAGYVLRRNPDTVYAPDVAFVRAERLPRGADAEGYFEGAPDLAVEVVSPSDTRRRVVSKVQDYLAAGTRMLLVIDAERRCVHVHRPDVPPVLLQEHDTLDGAEVVPAWRLPVHELFTPPPAAE